MQLLLHQRLLMFRGAASVLVELLEAKLASLHSSDKLDTKACMISELILYLGAGHTSLQAEVRNCTYM